MKKILFIAILLVAAAFRLFLLSTVPPSPSLDEATIGWNAYAILNTGHDEYGNFMPLLLRAYDDYRPALYVYLVVPFITLFGLTVISVRLPSVIMSIATVGMSFFLIRSILASYKKKDTVALLGMLLLALSPWHIYVSRLGHEVNLGLTLVIGATLLFFLFLEYKKGVFLIGSFAIFALSFYGYQSEKLFTPLFLLMLLTIYYKQIILRKKTALIGIVLAVLISLPMFFASLSPGALLRLKGTSVFIDNPAYSESAKQLLVAKNTHNTLGELLANRRVTTIGIFTQNYFSHFSVSWLIGNSGNEEFKAPHEGLLYVWELPFLLLGLVVFLFHKKIPWQIKTVITCWILLAFLPSAIATGAPHAMRSIILLPMPQLGAAFGIIFLLSFVTSRIGKASSIGVVFLLSIVVIQSLATFSKNYFSVFPIAQSKSFQYAMGNAMEYVKNHSNEYQRVIISNKDNLYQSYMFYLFYTKYDPKKYALMGGTKSGGFNETHRIGNIVFRPITWKDEDRRQTLFVGNPNDFPDETNLVFTSYYLDGTKGVTIIGEK